jgi:hypothetical protein
MTWKLLKREPISTGKPRVSQENPGKGVDISASGHLGKRGQGAYIDFKRL